VKKKPGFRGLAEYHFSMAVLVSCTEMPQVVSGKSDVQLNLFVIVL